MVGVRHIIVAVNKMDLVAYSKASFEAIERDYRMLAKSLGLSDVTIIPVSAVEGDNIADRSVHMPWYKGPTLISHLETVEISSRAEDHGFSFPVQWVNRPDSQFRGYSGQIASGIVHQGDTIRLVPHGGEARIDRIVTFDGDLEQAEKGQSVTLVLDRELDISRGDVIVSPEARIASAKSVVARIIWMSVEPLDAEKSYLFKLGTTTVAGTLIIPKSALDIETYQEMPLETVGINTIFDTRIGFDRTVATAIYQDNRDLGAFLVIDRVSNEVVALGLVSDAGRADQQKITKVSNHHHAQPWQFNAPRIKIIAFTLATFAIAFLVAAVASAFKIDMVAALVSFAFAEIILHAVIDHFFPTLLLRDPSMLKPGEGI
jgi:bifunctional enzyme CysN/CysC